jgi:hypothetical protein
MLDSYKVAIASMIIYFLTFDAILCFFNVALSLCMIMAIIALLVGRSQSKYELYSCIQHLKTKFAIVSTINSYAWYL